MRGGTDALNLRTCSGVAGAWPWPTVTGGVCGLNVQGGPTSRPGDDDAAMEARLQPPKAARDFKQVALISRRLRGGRGKSGPRPKRARPEPRAQSPAREEGGQEEEGEEEEGEEEDTEEDREASPAEEAPRQRARGRGRGGAPGRRGRGRHGVDKGPVSREGRPGGWQVLTYKRRSGKLEGQAFRLWGSPGGTKHRSLPAARRAGFTD